MQKYIIDGYNLIHRWSELKKVAEKNLQLSREKLITKLAGYRSNKKIEFVVVFDGNMAVDINELSRPGVRVIFSKPPDKADDLIKKLILETPLKSRRNLTVVSSDVEIINCAKACGAGRISADEFIKRVENLETETDEKPFVKLTPEEIEAMFKEKRGEEK